MNILQALDDPLLFKEFFDPPQSWRAWRTFLKTFFALPLLPRDLHLYKQATGRERPPTKAFNEAWLVVGRRGGKSQILALLGVFICLFLDWKPYLKRGDLGVCVIMATDRKQAKVIHRYCLSFLEHNPMFKKMIKKIGTDEITLTNNTAIEIVTANFRSLRGRTVIAALLDEVAFWRDESTTNPDKEILAALRPAMANVQPDAILVAASSPYAKRGVLYEAHTKHFGEEHSDVLVWQAATRTMNPNIPQSFIDAEEAKDPLSARAEYYAEFRSDVESYVSLDVVHSCMAQRQAVPPATSVNYNAFVDPSGGRNDSMTLAIGHRSNDAVIVDALIERKPSFKPTEVVEQFSKQLKRYRVGTVVGDRYGGEWPVEAFQKHGITYQLAAHNTSQLYNDFLPLLNSGEVELPDDPRLAMQLASLERKTTRGGRDSIDHPKNGHDDLANAVAGLASILGSNAPIELWGGGADETPYTYSEREAIEAGFNAGWSDL